MPARNGNKKEEGQSTNSGQDANHNSGNATGLRDTLNEVLETTQDLYQANFSLAKIKLTGDSDANNIAEKARILSEYAHVKDMAPPMRPGEVVKRKREESAESSQVSVTDAEEEAPELETSSVGQTGVTEVSSETIDSQLAIVQSTSSNAGAIVEKEAPPEWHAPWQLYRVISGHGGAVRAIDVDVSNEWFVTAGADRVIKVWDLATGQLKISLTGHIATVRGLALSQRHPYLFSCCEAHMVKCWDLEQNKVVRNYHGHLSGVYCIGVHPTIDLIVTGSRDSSARLWDMRTKREIFCLSGHTNTVWTVKTQALDPQVITGSMDSTVRLWDLRVGKTSSIITNHKKGVRGLVIHPREYTFVSASADNIKKFQCPKGRFLQNLPGHDAIINSLAVNTDGVLVSSANNGSMFFWDYRTGYNFDRVQTRVQPGSLESEAGVYASAFDMTGSRFITCEADKTIKMWKENENATPESHPVKWKPSLKKDVY